MKRWIEKQHEYENEEVIFDRQLYNNNPGKIYL